jgi:hypothetical protein
MKAFHTLRFILLIFVFAITTFTVEGQIVSTGHPLYLPGEKNIHVPVFEVPFMGLPLDSIPTESYFKKNTFASTIEVAISPLDQGIWVEKPEKDMRIWLLAIKSQGASSINLVFNPFELTDEVKLFIYDSLQTEVIGAITSSNNKQTMVLPTSLMHNDFIYCELQVPLNSFDFGKLNIAKIGIGLEKARSISLKSTEDYWFGRSTDCNVNVNCYTNEYLQQLKKSTCRIIFSGSDRCTGTLINNLSSDGTPYVYTAAHCIRSEEEANEAVFYFNYESPDCSDIDVTPQTISGASLVSAGIHRKVIVNEWDTLDFSLLKLSEKPPVNYNVVYAGWDATGNEVDSAYVIHHPVGDIKKVSFDSDAPITDNFGFGFDPNTHWRVESYEVGTSEIGSSGAALLSPENRIIGSLSGGGQFACVNSINDYYQKFYHAYADYDQVDYQLKHWLDPKNTGILLCEAFEPHTSETDNPEFVNINVYPIPAKSELTVNLSALPPGGYTLKIYNLEGAVVFTSEVHSTVNQVDLNTELESGFYLLTIESVEELIGRAKVIIQ